MTTTPNILPVYSRETIDKTKRLRDEIGELLEDPTHTSKTQEDLERIVRSAIESIFNGNGKIIGAMRPYLEKIGLQQGITQGLPAVLSENTRAEYHLITTGYCEECDKQEGATPVIEKRMLITALTKGNEIAELLGDRENKGKLIWDNDLKPEHVPHCNFHERSSLLTSNVHSIISCNDKHYQDLEEKTIKRERDHILNINDLGEDDGDYGLFEMRVKSGWELIRKITEFLMGQRVDVIDTVGMRIVVPEKQYASTVYKLLKNWNPSVTEVSYTPRVPLQNTIYGQSAENHTHLLEWIAKELKQEDSNTHSQHFDPQFWQFVEENSTKETKEHLRYGMVIPSPTGSVLQEFPMCYTELNLPLAQNNVVNVLCYSATEYQNGILSNEKLDARAYANSKLRKQDSWPLLQRVIAKVVGEHLRLLEQGEEKVIQTEFPKYMIKNMPLEIKKYFINPRYSFFLS